MNRRLLALIILFAMSVLMIATYQHLQRNSNLSIRMIIWQTLNGEDLTLPVFKTKPLVIWSSDLHIGPANDLKYFLQPMGVKFIDKTLDYTRCYRTKNCAAMNTFKVINPHNVKSLDYSLIPKFYDAYANDSEIQSADAFACFHAAALCELYAPFNKSLIIIASIRYEYGRFGQERWTKWNENLIRYASMPWNVIGANNLYDVNYIKYFTGIEGQWLPSFSRHTNQTYNPIRKGFLIAHNSNTGFYHSFLGQYAHACKTANCTVEVTAVKHKYGEYKYADIAAHQGIIHVPYQVSVMSFFEQYRMYVPLFAPSKELLIQWEFKYRAMRERTWEGAHGPQPVRSAINPHPSQRSVPDPNSYQEHAVRYWINFCDYYNFPHIIYYDSIPHLISLVHNMTSDELMQISERMKLFGMEEERRLRAKWKGILLRIAKHSSNSPH